jgi:NADPH-dependent curcumin reductase CurA
MNYAGKRVIVAGAPAEFVARLVDLGAEAHVIGTEKPAVSGIASFTECDLTDDAQIDSAVTKIGKIVNVLFDCVGSAHLVEAVLPNMIEGSRVLSVSDIPLDAMLD